MKKNKPHWYFISTWYCVLCGKTENFRERRYDKRPDKYEDRHGWKEHGCYSCQYEMFIA